MVILLIQFRTNKSIAKHERKCIARSLGNKVKVISKNVFGKNFNLSKNNFSLISGIIMGGSAEFSFSKKKKLPELWPKIRETTPFIKEAIKKNTPILGICFGHQYLSYILGSEIINDKSQKEVGASKIYLTEIGKSDILFSGVPAEFLAQEGHEDSVKKLPRGAILLATGEKCKIQSFRFKDFCYGVQFHPELNNAKDVKFRIKVNPNYITGEKRIKIKSSLTARRVLRNFLRVSK